MRYTHDDDSWEELLDFLFEDRDPMPKPREEAVDQHQHEHHGPGGIRNHDERWFGWTEDDLKRVLEEAEEM